MPHKAAVFGCQSRQQLQVDFNQVRSILELKVDENYAVRDRLMACTNFHNFQNCFIEFFKENHHHFIGMLLNNSMNALPPHSLFQSHEIAAIRLLSNPFQTRLKTNK